MIRSHNSNRSRDDDLKNKITRAKNVEFAIQIGCQIKKKRRGFKIDSDCCSSTTQLSQIQVKFSVVLEFYDRSESWSPNDLAHNNK